MTRTMSVLQKCLAVFIMAAQLLSAWKVAAVAVPATVNETPAKKTARSEWKPEALRGGAKEERVIRRFAGSSSDTRMPSLFRPNEAEYSKFAACLAATEGIRRMRDQALLELDYRAKRGEEDSPNDSEYEIGSHYQDLSGKVLKALGMSIDRFNELGQEISKNERLKEKVMEQAYLFRMSAMINMDQIPLFSMDKPDSTDNFQRDKVHLFCQSVEEIERMRADQVERLKKALRVDSFPKNVHLSDPELLPFLSPRVRAVVKAFPLQAEDIARKYGLDSQEFNKMLEESRSNPMMRWKMQKHLKEVRSSFDRDE